MAGWLLDGGFDGEAHRRLKADALRAMGQVTTAANTRSWYLTQARELEGRVDTRVLPFRFVNAGMVRQMPPATYVNGLRFLLPPGLSADGAKTIHLRFEAPEHAFTLRLRNGVVVIDAGLHGSADASVTMSFDAWARLVGREAKAGVLLEHGEIVLAGDAQLARAVLVAGGPINA
ncbi:MAG: alkyl sulfatase C-terminal domain-containing protein [Rubrivivax sp.]